MNNISNINAKWMFPLQSESSAMKAGGELGAAASQNSGPQSSSSFIDSLKGALNEVNELQVKADVGIKDQIAGKPVNLTDVLITMQQADMSLRTAVAVRNKMVEAYTEIMRMQV